MYTLSEKVEYLKNCSLFETIPHDELKLIAYTASEICCKEGYILFEEGDKDFDAFVIFDGEVEVYKKGPGGEKIVFKTLKKYDIFGEFAIISTCLRTAGVRVTRELKGLKINKEAFLDILNEFPRVSIRIMDFLVHRLVNAEKRLMELQI